MRLKDRKKIRDFSEINQELLTLIRNIKFTFWYRALFLKLLESVGKSKKK